MSGKTVIFLIVLTVCICVYPALCCAEDSSAADSEKSLEQGVDEIQQLVEISDLPETEGIGLEELTESFSDTAMADYSDEYTGFFMQYPSIFVFDEQKEFPEAWTADGTAMLRIENMPNEGELTEEALTEAIRLQDENAEIRKNEHNGCLRVDAKEKEGKTIRSDLYLISDRSFHHVVLYYPSDEEERFDLYINYMINTIEINGTDQG